MIKRSWFAVMFLLYVIWELVLSSFRVAFDVLRPGLHHMKPGVVALALDEDSAIEIAILALAVTLTPGTLTLDVSKDRRTMFIHSMYAQDRDALCRCIKRQLERRVLRVI
jgi:multicomponent Na+:H+ antiporter subunit E